MKAIKKVFTAACVRTGIEDLRAYDLRHTFATRLLERGVHHFVISALLGHAMPMAGFGFSSRTTSGYAHATWDTIVAAVATLEEHLQQKQRGMKMDQVRKVGSLKGNGRHANYFEIRESAKIGKRAGTLHTARGG